MRKRKTWRGIARKTSAKKEDRKREGIVLAAIELHTAKFNINLQRKPQSGKFLSNLREERTEQEKKRERERNRARQSRRSFKDSNPV